jgi:hypothetical protein
MRVFKTIDILIQLFTLFAIGINILLQGQKDVALLCVIGFGAWQVISSLIQLFLKFKKTWWRLIYSIIGVIILCLLLAIKLKIFSEDNFISLMLMLAPAMGVYYFILSIVETVEIYRNKQSEQNLIID